MSDVEFENQFDVLYNNITSNQAPGLNSYEKSVFLTKAQDEVVKNHFSASSKGNNLGQGFDDNQKRQIDFSMLTTSKKITDTSIAAFDTRSNSKSVKLPSDVMMIINELVQVTRGSNTVDLVVIPLRFDEYNRLMSKPYKRPVKTQAWRLINSSTSNSADIIVGPNDEITSYIVRYIRAPKPIIIGDLDGLTINGYSYGSPLVAEEGPGRPASLVEPVADLEDHPQIIMKTKGCELDPMLHEEILQRAIELAKLAWTATGQDNAQFVIQAGQRSE